MSDPMSDLPPLPSDQPNLASGLDKLADKVEALTAAVPPVDRPELVDGLDRLADKVEGLTAAVQDEARVRSSEIARTRDQVAAVEQAERRSRRAVGALAVVALLVALTLAGVWARSAVVACENNSEASTPRDCSVRSVLFPTQVEN